MAMMTRGVRRTPHISLGSNRMAPHYIVRAAASATAAAHLYMSEAAASSSTAVAAAAPNTAAAVTRTAAPTSRDGAASAHPAGIASVLLYQYDSCPFCNKVRAYLDLARIPYIVVEVNPLLKSEVAWAADWGKVPIAVINGVRVVDSSNIIDHCEALLRAQQQQLQAERLHLTALSARGNTSTTSTSDISTPTTPALSGVVPLGCSSLEEAQWRAWVDTNLLILLAPNIYRTLPESWAAFEYMTARNFSPAAAVLPARVIGSVAMWGLSGRLKAKYGIVGDPRPPLYTALDTWVAGVGPHRPFMGGHSPGLADAALWGVLRAVRGLPTESDVLQHSRIGPWFGAMAREMDGVGSALQHRVGEAPPVRA